MIFNVPTLDEAIQRSVAWPGDFDPTPKNLEKDGGTTLWLCDEPECKAKATLEAPVLPSECPNCGSGLGTGATFCANCGVKVAKSSVPKGWRTSQADNDPHVGGAQFCPKHATNIYVPSIDAPETLIEHPVNLINADINADE